ncbi:hypothetical protein O6H91_06G064700 [Diphasiastrum complanatum]|uniref:Uncharacterized protein n=1 Tax=Diphasiastrum complanatum TaxID=34168 RepID=A0ACC2DEH8_DIPCM|nr:hypothetical protein O6H91_06G064700 [Diphasiastrum complanatum]
MPHQHEPRQDDEVAAGLPAGCVALAGCIKNVRLGFNEGRNLNFEGRAKSEGASTCHMGLLNSQKGAAAGWSAVQAFEYVFNKDLSAFIMFVNARSARRRRRSNSPAVGPVSPTTARCHPS